MIYDVAVIGSGPSGASAAFHLAQQGLKCIIIEKEKLPRYKTCGGGFVFRGRQNIPFAISSVVEREFHSVDINFDTQNLHFKTERNEPIITMVMRDAFDHLIVRQAQDLGVKLLQSEALQGLTLGEIAQVQTTKQTIQSRFVIAADGALSKTAKLAGWSETRMMCPALEYEVQVHPSDFERLSTTARFDIDAVPMGYGWSFPKQNHLSIGVGNFMKNNKNPKLKNHYNQYLKQLGVTEVLTSTSHGFIIPITPRKDGFVKKNVFLIGDAAGFADPLTAEGISNALYSGKLVAEAIGKSEMDFEQAACGYNQSLEQRLLPELNTGAQLAKLFYEQKKLRNLILQKYGQRAAELMTDIFMGHRTYPHNYKKSIKKRLKKAVLH